MRGISSSLRESLEKILDDMFDRMSLGLLGQIPKLKHKKHIIFTARPSQTLAHLFVQALGSTQPLPAQEEAMKSLLDTAHSYIDSLRSKTKAKVVGEVDSYVREARMRGETPSATEIKTKILDGLQSAKTHFTTISQAEATKARNMGKAMKIGQVAASFGIKDPTVFFVVVKDNILCPECKRLHLQSDETTPRVWKLSEIKFNYHKKGEENPSVAGLHPHCRCTLTLLSPGFGFTSSGNVSYISMDHDEYKKQRG